MAIQGGLFQLAQTMGMPSQLSAQQRGIFDVMGTALAPQSARVNSGDPASFRTAAESAIEKGDMAQANQLMQMGQQTEQRQAQGREQNIRKAYAQMSASGRGEQFEAALVQGGEGDLLAKILKEQRQATLDTLTYGSAVDADRVKEMRNSYFSAETEEGKDLVLETMKKSGYGEAAKDIRQAEATQKIKDFDTELRRGTEQYNDKIAQAKTIPVPTTQQGRDRLKAELGKRDPDLLAVYEEQELKILNARVQLQKAQEKAGTSEAFPEKFFSDLPMSHESYRSLYSVAPAEANKAALKAYEASLRSAEGKSAAASQSIPFLPSAMYTQLQNLFDEVNHVDGFFMDSTNVDETTKQRVVQEAWRSMVREGVAPDEAMRRAIGNDDMMLLIKAGL